MSAPRPLRRGDRRGAIGMAVVLALWSFGPSLSKRVLSPPLVTVFYRMWAGAALHWIVCVALRRRPDLATLRRTALPGVFFAANLVAFFYALRHASVANVALISALQPAVVLVVAGPVFGERLTRWAVMWTLVALGGAAVAVLGSDSASAPTSLLGVLLSVIALFCFTSYFLLSKRASGSAGGPPLHPLTYMTGVITMAAVLVTPISLLGSPPSLLLKLSRGDQLAIALVVCVPSLGHIAMSWTHPYIDVTVSSLVLLILPMTAALVAWPLNGQPVALVQAVGAIIVLGALGAVISRRTPTPNIPRPEAAVRGPSAG